MAAMTKELPGANTALRLQIRSLRLWSKEGVEVVADEARVRWAKAENAASGIVDEGVGEAVRTYFQRWLPPLFLLLTVAGMGIAAVAFSNDGAWVRHLALGVNLACVGCFVGGFVYWAKRINPRVHPKKTAVLIWLEKKEQKDIAAQITCKTAPNPDHLTVARGAAIQDRLNLAMQIVLAPAYALLPIAQLMGVRSLGPWWAVFWIVMLALFVGLLVFAIHRFRAVGRFLTGLESR
jgi:protein-S-isoprenylcysteine O-methyltransferase Ste14